MPNEGIELRPKHEMLSFEEIVRLTRLFAREGITKIRLTGGEPLIRRDIEQLVSELRAIDGIKSIAVTTNGLLLSQKIAGLKKAGVTLFNISLDTLQEDRFTAITRRPGLAKVLSAIEDTWEAGYDPVKINCVVQKGVNDDELLDFVELTRDRPYEVRFIEFMPFGGNAWDDGQFMSYDNMLARVRGAHADLTRDADDSNHTTKMWHIPGYAGQVGFISSMSDDFCSTCNRLRLTADGNLKVCLFGAGEVSLRDEMRSGKSDEEILPIIAAAVGKKKAAHAGMIELSKMENRPMILIGG
jgi:molybdenum cofactor biosynthesis protein A